MTKFHELSWSTLGSIGALILAMFGMYGAFAVLPVEIGHLKEDVSKLERKVDEANEERNKMSNTLTRIDQRLQNIDESLRELKARQ